jgi:hypothetical protein
MPNTIIGSSPEVQDEIERALTVLKKNRYKATVQEDGSGDLSILFEFGANDQTLKIKKEERDNGGIEKKIVNDLDI